MNGGDKNFPAEVEGGEELENVLRALCPSMNWIWLIMMILRSCEVEPAILKVPLDFLPSHFKERQTDSDIAYVFVFSTSYEC